MANKKQKRSRSKSKTKPGLQIPPKLFTLKNVLIVIVFAVVGGFLVYKSFAAGPPYSRLTCTPQTRNQKYASTAECYNRSIEGSTARAFTAVLNRQPEVGALQYWSNVYNTYGSAPQQAVIDKILHSSEAQRKFTTLPNDARRVTYLYNSVLKRNPDSGGAKYWEKRLKNDDNWSNTIASFLGSSEALKKMEQPTVATLNKLPATWRPTRAAKTVSPRGTYSSWIWQPPASGFSNLEHTLTVNSYKPGSNYFWSHQFGFINGDGGYIGLQSTGVPNGDGTYRKQAVFSIFGAAIAAAPDYCKVEQAGFDGGAGSGSRCIRVFNWVPGRTYKLKTAVTTREATTTTWSGWVIDTVTGSETLIGRIKVPSPWKGLGNWSVMWTENFVSTATACGKIPYSKVSFSKPTATNNVLPASSSQYLSKVYECTNSKITTIQNGVVQEVGSLK